MNLLKHTAQCASKESVQPLVPNDFMRHDIPCILRRTDVVEDQINAPLPIDSLGIQWSIKQQIGRCLNNLAERCIFHPLSKLAHRLLDLGNR